MSSIEEINDTWKQIKNRKGAAGFSGAIKKKETNGEVTDEDCILVYVEEKLPENKISIRNLVPLHMNIDGVMTRTDVKAIGKMAVEIPKKLDPKKKYRPILGGISAIAEGLSACTLGWFAEDNKDPERKIGITANNHCAANENKFKRGHPYLSPSPYDGGTSSDKIAELERFVELPFETYNCMFRNVFGLRNRYRVYMRDKGYTPRAWCSADIALLKKISPHLLRLLTIGKLNGKRRGEIGEFAHKDGRTTGYTSRAELIDNDYYGSVQYSRGKLNVGPCGLLEGDNFSAGGDSSSAIPWEKDNFLGGQLFGGSDTHTLFDHYDLLEIQLDVTYVF